MSPRNPLMWTCVIAAGSATAHADIFTWFANSGTWENHNMWNGPVGQYPDSILDTATINGSTSQATLSQNLALGTLNVINGAAVYSANNSIFVNADTILSGSGGSISVTETPSLRDFDTDTLTINSAALAMYGGLAQFDEALVINSNGAVLGVGTIEMNSTTGDLELNNGNLWAVGGSGPGTTMLVTRTDSSTSKLDWTSSDARITVWEGKTLHNELPYSGALGGEIWVSGTGGSSRFISDDAFIAGNGSEIRLSGPDGQNTARIEAPAADIYGLVTVSGVGIIDAPIVALRGEVELQSDSTLSIPASLLIFNSLDVTAVGGGSTIQLGQAGSTLSVIGGATNIALGSDSAFDLDGSGDKTVNIADGSTLSLEVEQIDIGAFPLFSGELNIDGALHVPAVNGANEWRSNGQITLDSGSLTGRRLDSSGVIKGTGSVEAFVINNGEIIADGGTLGFGFVNMDGGEGPATGILRAQTGDLVMNMQSDGATHQFTGSIFVGNGTGIREVLNADVDLHLRDIDGVRGSMHLDSGFVVLEDFLSYGDVTVDGDSLIRVTGTNDADRISFTTGSVTTITGTLEVDGRTWFVPGAQVLGEGTLHAVSTVKGLFLQDGADLGDVGVIAAGPVTLTDVFESTATVRSFTMEPTAALNISLSTFPPPVNADRLIVRDDAVLDGELILTRLGQDDLPVGVTMTVLTAGNLTGEFSSIDDSGLGPNRRAYVTVDNDSVDVFITCTADLNADGAANFFDLSQFVILFNSMDPDADLNEDGQFNFFDLSIFIQALDLGC